MMANVVKLFTAGQTEMSVPNASLLLVLVFDLIAIFIIINPAYHQLLSLCH